MQRSLLPRAAPELPGLELGDVYESSARVEVGGDVYDYLTLDDGRLAVVLGDVMGHGVDATADMAMAKFVFRSLAREHLDPGGVPRRRERGRLVRDRARASSSRWSRSSSTPTRGEVACASAGHPPPRLVLPDGTVESIPARGLALGIDAPQAYAGGDRGVPAGRDRRRLHRRRHRGAARRRAVRPRAPGRAARRAARSCRHRRSPRPRSRRAATGPTASSPTTSRSS